MRWLVLSLLVLSSPAAATLPGGVGDRAVFLPQVAQEAAADGVPPEIADAVAIVETGYRPDAIGSSGEIGIMQILPSTAAQLGFHGTTAELLEPSINIHLAVQYLGRAWALSGGDICRALMKYRAGLGEEVMSPLSAQYCSRAIGWLMGEGSRFAAGAHLPEGAPPPQQAADPHVITIGPAPIADMPIADTPIPDTPIPGETVTHIGRMPVSNVKAMLAEQLAEKPAALRTRRRSMAERAAALQASFDSHVRYVGDHAVTSFDSGN